MAEFRTLILANGSIGTPGNDQTVQLFHMTPIEFGMSAPWRVRGAYLWVYQEGNGLVQAAGNDTWLYSDFCKNHIPNSTNPIDAGFIVGVNKLEPHNPITTPDKQQNYSAWRRVDFGGDWILANYLELYTQPQAGTTCYVYCQVDVYV